MTLIPAPYVLRLFIRTHSFPVDLMSHGLPVHRYDENLSGWPMTGFVVELDDEYATLHLANNGNRYRMARADFDRLEERPVSPEDCREWITRQRMPWEN